MKQKILFFILLITSFVFGQKTKEVLFIGNSYTFTYNIPNTTKLLADSAGDNLIHDSNAIPWYKLIEHANNTECIQKIESKNWDHVILQEFSTYPAYNFLSFYNGSEKLISLINSNNPCINSTILFMTWGRQNDANMPYDEMQSATKDSYINIATRFGTEVSPVGIAWKKVRDDGDPINLYKPDGSHQSFAGTYLAACVFYATIFDKTPVGLTYKGSLSDGDAAYLQEKAYEAYNEYLAMGLIHNTNTDDVIEDIYRVNIADSNSELNNKVINSPNNIQTIAYINYTGLTDNAIKTPILNYTIKQNDIIIEQKDIPVTINLNENICNNTTTNLPLNIDISNVTLGDFELNIFLNNNIYNSFNLNKSSILSVANHKAHNIKIFPNPVYDNLSIKSNTIFNDNLSISIYNKLGQQIFTENTKLDKLKNVINLSNLISGIYFIKIENGNSVFSQKFMKN